MPDASLSALSSSAVASHLAISFANIVGARAAIVRRYVTVGVAQRTLWAVVGWVGRSRFDVVFFFEPH